MNQFIRKSLQKFDKLPAELSRGLVENALSVLTLLENIVDSIPQGILVCDAQHNLVLNNVYARHILPFDGEETGKHKAWEAVKDNGVKDFLYETLKAGVDIEEHEIELEGTERTRLVSFTIHPLVREGHIAGSIILISDITQRRVKEAKLKQMESLASLTTLAAGVAHEIKNPLAAISIHVQILKKSVDKIRECCEKADKQCAPELENHLEVVSDEIRRLNKIVVDFLFAVRPMELVLRKTNINELVSEVLRLEKSEAEAAGITCGAELDESIPPLVIDKQRMREALVNLVKNAIEAAGTHGAEFDESTQRGYIRCATKMNGERVLLSVTDNGPGISSCNLTRVFDPYWTTKADGSGLGLTLVFKVIQAHNGEITVHSSPGEGACFLISLPAPGGDIKMLETNSGQ